MKIWGIREGEESKKTSWCQILRTVFSLFIYLTRCLSNSRVSSKTVFFKWRGVMKSVKGHTQQFLIKENKPGKNMSGGIAHI